MLTLSDEFGDCDVNMPTESLCVPIVTFPFGLRLAFISVTVLKYFELELFPLAETVIISVSESPS